MTPPAIRTGGIDHVVIYVSDLARSLSFYLDVLGMTVRSTGGGYAFLYCGDGPQQLGLFEAGEGRTPKVDADLNHLALAVAAGTREEIVTSLARHGVKARGRPGDPHCIYLDDPDGHCIQLVVPRGR